MELETLNVILAISVVIGLVGGFIFGRFVLKKAL